MTRKHVKTRYPGVFYRHTKDGKRAYEITFRDESGRQRWQRVYGDQEAARDALEAVRAKLRGGVPVKPEKRTFQEVHDEWAAIYLPRLRASTRATYEKSLKNYVLPEFGATVIQRIDERRLAKWITDLQARGLKAWTIRAALTPLRRILTYAVRERLIPENPCGRLGRDEMPKSDQRERRILDRDELGRLLSCASDRYRVALEVLAFTGLRASELLGLVWRDIDLKTGELHVRYQLGAGDDGEVARVPLKTKESARTVYLMPSLVKALRAHKLAMGHSLAGDYVFAQDDGGPMTYPALEGGFKYAVIKAKLGEPRPTLHSLRHGFGSMLAKQTGDTAFVSKRMGHANPAITARLYMHELESAETAKRSVEDMARAFGDLVRG